MDTYITVAMYAEERGVSVQAIYKMIDTGKIKPYYNEGLTWINVDKYPPTPKRQGRVKVTKPIYLNS